MDKKIKDTIDAIRPLDKSAGDIVQARLDSLTKPQGSFGRLEGLVKQIAGITGDPKFELAKKTIFVLAADHGVALSGVSAYPQEVTAQMVYNFVQGGAAINVLARHASARVVVADLGVKEELKIDKTLCKMRKINRGTKNFHQQPAMTDTEARNAVVAGIELLEEESANGLDIAGIGEMGIGNTASASAIIAAVTKRRAQDVTGRGTGLDDKGYCHKVAVIEQSLRLLKPKADDPWDVLAKVGGFEIAGLTGIILACAKNRIPVVLDGFICGAAALLAFQLAPQAKECMIAAHCSVEKGHKITLEYLGLKPILDLDLRLGEGSGAALAFDLIDASRKILNEMATFKDAGVSGKTKS